LCSQAVSKRFKRYINSYFVAVLKTVNNSFCRIIYFYCYPFDSVVSRRRYAVELKNSELINNSINIKTLGKNIKSFTVMYLEDVVSIM